MINNLCILLWDANGLISWRMELEALFHHEKINIALITETHCTKEYFHSRKDYNVVHSFHPISKAQGVQKFTSKNRLIVLQTWRTPWHNFNCAVRFPINGKYLTLGSVYCSPLCKIISVDFDILFQHLSDTWIVGGDFNAKHAMWGSRMLCADILWLTRIYNAILRLGTFPSTWKNSSYNAVQTWRNTYWACLLSANFTFINSQ